MNFELTAERKMLQDTLRRFFQDHYSHSAIQSWAESESGFSTTVWASLAELGVIGALFSEANGGFGGDGFDLALVFEELGRVGALEPLLDTAVLGGGLLAEAGNPAQQQLVDDVINGTLHLSLAHVEPRSRYELSRVETTARRAGNQFVLNGQKAVVINANCASHLIVSARTAGNIDDTHGVSLFLVPVDTEGLHLQEYSLQSGGRAAELSLENVTLDSHALLGAQDAAHDVLERVQARATLAICAEALGLMDAMSALTIDYLKVRNQFGQPIGRFQVLQHRMADVVIEIEQARSAVINLAGHLNSPRPEREKHVSATKNLVGLVAKQVAEESVQMHGGIGVTMEYELGHLVRRLVMMDHRFGDTTHHLERYVELAISDPTLEGESA